MKNSMLTLFSFILMIGIIGCSDDDDSANLCAGALNNGSTMSFNGQALQTSIAQLIISSNSGVDSYFANITGFSDDCNMTTTISFNVDIPANSDLNGTYEVKDFFNAGINDVTGMVIAESDLNSTSQSLIEVKSGTIMINKIGASEYDASMSGSLSGGGSFTAAFRATF